MLCHEQEVSGYLDFAHRLATDEAGMAAAFALEQPLMPQPTDLSCFNWTTNRIASCNSPNFEVRGQWDQCSEPLLQFLALFAGCCRLCV